MSRSHQHLNRRPRVLEFFAGIGLARLGLERAGMEVAWANDIEPAKASMYEAQFGAESREHYQICDIASVSAADVPADIDLAWASSPCTDLSLAGGRAGLGGSQSGTFWEFIRIIKELGSNRPECIVLENVVGLATSHGGEDIKAAIRAFNELGYSADVLIIDARRFVPQSRPRLFMVGLKNPPVQDMSEFGELRPPRLRWIFEDENLITHRFILPAPPDLLDEGLGCLMEEVGPNDERWWSDQRIASFMASLSSTQKDRIAELVGSSGIKYRTAYRRTRNGNPVWEVRPDDISGCLRAARGGSSKQAVVRLGNGELRVRWMTSLEYASLMGAGAFNLSGSRANQILFGFGDAVAVPVVEWLAANYLLPVIDAPFGSESANCSDAVSFRG